MPRYSTRRSTLALTALFALVALGIALTGIRNIGAARQPNADRHPAVRPDSIALARADSLASARQDSINRAQPGYVIDSILPPEEELRRFRAMAGDPVSTLSGGADSRDALVASFAAAVERSDRAALDHLTIDVREFAYLVYPSSPYTKPPFRQPPGLLWRLVRSPSDAGAARLLQRMGGKPLAVAGYRCDARVERQGENRLHTGCLLELTNPDGAISRHRLFGPILERHGRFKFVSLQNEM